MKLEHEQLLLIIKLYFKAIQDRKTMSGFSQGELERLDKTIDYLMDVAIAEESTSGFIRETSEKIATSKWQ